MASNPDASVPLARSWIQRFGEVRGLTDALAAPLSPEDQTVQSMPDVSPTKWHRAHTTWFFEEFVLGPYAKGYEPLEPCYRFLFNSYYEAVGPRHPRAARGVITRPTSDDVGAFRSYVDDAMAELLDSDPSPEVLDLVELGLHHEQQHQELLLMDIKHVLAQNLLDPVYLPSERRIASASALPVAWHGHDGGRIQIGKAPATTAGDGFGFDNESPQHSVWLEPFELADRPVSNGEVIEFIADGGYQRPDLWLSDGWATVMAQGWQAPLYWRPEPDDRLGTGWSVFTLGGRTSVDPAEPACHLSYYEADAIARWSGARLPTEGEWEAMASGQPVEGNLLDLAVLHPQAPAAHPTNASDATVAGGPRQLFGDVWEWTASAYLPYPGFSAAPGAVGEYNGKFMVNQHVLRGGACATPAGHVRPTYRNFFPPSARWAFSGVRLARGLDR